MDVSRRNFIIGGVCAVAYAAIPRFSLASSYTDFKPLTLFNLHTSEKLAVKYRDQGQYFSSALNDIKDFFRDYRNGEQHQIDPRLLDRVYALDQYFGSNNTIELISGYRSPTTNSMLSERSSGVARNSFHMHGKAADIRFTGKNLNNMYEAAKSMNFGGTGIYGKSQFIHVDTGPVRSWVGR